MKKFLVIASAALLMMGLAGQAQAFFTSDGTSTGTLNGDLLRVVYQLQANGGTAELVTDLGSAANILNGTSGALLSNTVSLFGSGTEFSGTNPTTLEVAYFAMSTNKSTFYTSGPQGGTEQNVSSTWIGIKGEIPTMYQTYAGYASGAQSAWAPYTNTNSYYFYMNGNADSTIGTFNGFYKGTNDGDTKLPADGNSINNGIFVWTKPGTANQTVVSTFTLETAIDANGNLTTEIPGAATPIPPSVLLFGSGLLGLIGVRRRDIFNF